MASKMLHLFTCGEFEKSITFMQMRLVTFKELRRKDFPGLEVRLFILV